MAKTKTKKINLGWLVRSLAPMVFNGIDYAIENIPNKPAKMALQLAAEQMKNAVEILTDGEKDNAKQFADYYKNNWRELSEKTLDVVAAFVAENSPETAKDVTTLKDKIVEL